MTAGGIILLPAAFLMGGVAFQVRENVTKLKRLISLKRAIVIHSHS